MSAARTSVGRLALEGVVVVLGILIAFVLWSPTLDLSFGAVNALISSGRLSHIRDDELRLGLAGLQDAFDDGVEGEVTERQIFNAELALAHPGPHANQMSTRGSSLSFHTTWSVPQE